MTLKVLFSTSISLFFLDTNLLILLWLLIDSFVFKILCLVIISPKFSIKSLFDNSIGKFIPNKLLTTLFVPNPSTNFFPSFSKIFLSIKSSIALFILFEVIRFSLWTK